MKKWILLACLILACGCAHKEGKTTLKVAATPVPHAQMLRFVMPQLKDMGIELEIIEATDFSLPNRALAEKEIDANFFQHVPFMEEQIKYFGYKIQCLARIHLEPMAIYSDKVESLNDLSNGATIALPNDPTNEYRALKILEEKGLIKLKADVGITATVTSIEQNPKKFKFLEIDAAMLPRTLKDVDAAAINTNFALQAGLQPSKDALAIESADSPYANIITVRIGDATNPKLQALKKAMLSDKMRSFILKEFKGAIIPILKDCE